MDSTILLEANNIHKSYGDIKVLRGIDLTVNKGEIISIVGASGAGKSTLLHILGSLDGADSGTIQLNGSILSQMKRNQLAKFRNLHIGFIFQFHNLMPEFTALENVCIPGYIGKQQRASVVQKAREMLSLLGLASRMNHKPSQLSGGEQQRTAVARALINSPSIVFADEPSGNLDSQSADELHKLFFDLRSSLKQTFVIVTHNEMLANLADRKLTIQDGQVV